MPLAAIPLVVSMLLAASWAAHAEVAQEYPGGCSVTYAEQAPSTCHFIGVSSQPVDVLFAGTGTITIRADSSTCDPSGAGDLGPSPTGLYHPVPIGACGYTVTVAGIGTATVVDPNVRFWGQCEGTSSCDYDALQGPGTVVGELTATQQATLTLTVYDVTTNVSLVTTCSSTGTGSVTVACSYPETQYHNYEVQALWTVTGDVGVPVVLAVG
jgi:hypothetical protein